ncbi:nodulation protein NfeD [candidate division CSSED10-310 bacterium]|uniref:Nodulation protein NfeD n=1 Tax=candidate division CSSED10-310 bacterium TaxID=2855610 RepID=A0ABV6YXG9_UNCC1
MNRLTIMMTVFVCTIGVWLPHNIEARHVDVIEINDTINPAVFEYITESISRAESEQAECLIIQMDTPGGLLTSTQKIVRQILNSKIPVVVYISPRGSWAASAGTFITLASHVAAMAPSTNIGAAHPVSMAPSSPDQKKAPPDSSDDSMKRLEKKLDKFIKKLSPKADKEKEKSETTVTDQDKTTPDSEKETEIQPQDEEENIDPKNLEKDIMSEKIIQNTTAWIRGIATYRGRNAEWAEKAVTESLSITETEALEKNVIDLIAKDLDELLDKIHGLELKTAKGDIVLNTEKIQINTYEMTFRQKILSIISNPNLFFVLVLLGPLGLVIELYNPGLILPGVVGGISIILLLYASQVLPVNYAAMLLILLAIILFIAEIKIQSYGLLTVGGIICIALGGLMLFRTGPELPGTPFRVAYTTIITVTGVLLAFVLLVLERVLRVHAAPATTGSQGLIGNVGEARTDIAPVGRVFVHGELWNAKSDKPISQGAQIIVLTNEGLTLIVKEHIIP